MSFSPDLELSSIYLERLRTTLDVLQQLHKENQDYRKAVQATYQILEQLRLHPQLAGALSLSAAVPLPEEELPVYLDFLSRVIEQLLKTGLETELLKRVRQGLTHLLPRLWYSPAYALKTFEKMRPVLEKGAQLFNNIPLQLACQKLETLPMEQQMQSLIAAITSSLSEQAPEQTGLLVGTTPNFARQVLTLCQLPGLYWQSCATWQEAVQKAMISPLTVVIFQWDMEQSHTFPTAEALEQMDSAEILAVTSDFSETRLEELPERISQLLELKWLPRFLPDLLRKSLLRQEALSRHRQSDFLTGLPSPLGISKQYEQLQNLFGRLKTPMALAVLKLERFKLVESEQGPYLASQWLKSFAQKLKSGLRKTDVIGRWSPDRFILLFPHTPVAGAVIALEKLQHTLTQDQPFLNNPEYLPAFSAGLVQVKPDMIFEEALLAGTQLMQEALTPGSSPIRFHAEELNQENQPHILLLDDDPLILQMLHFVMSKQGFQVTQLSDGSQILNILSSTPVSLVIMDVKMPGVDGFEVLEMIRKRREFDELPVVMLSSLKGEEHIARGFELGANDYLYKPFSPSELVIRIRRFLN